MKPLRVFVFLPRSLDAMAWKSRFVRGEVPDKTPYGYHFAEEAGALVSFSRPTATPGGLLGLIDKGVRRVLGFDLRHAWGNRTALTGTDFDVVWTHTEYEHLACAALRMLVARRGPPVIAQSVWLIDQWRRWSKARQAIYRMLLKRSAIATFLSPENASFAERLPLPLPCAFVLFGISLDAFPLNQPRVRFEAGRRIRVLALGNDRHRDWKTLFEALGGKADCELRVGSSTWPRAFTADNVCVGSMTQEEVRSAYAWADCVVVPLLSNMHASGITAILEAVSLGIPVIATRIGGLEAYFDGEAMAYVAPGDEQALRAAVRRVAAEPAWALGMAVAAQRELVERDLTTRGYAMRHVCLSERLLGQEDAGGGNIATLGKAI